MTDPDARPSFVSRLSPRTRRAIVAGTWLVATTLVVLAFRAIGWRETVAALRRADARWLFAAFLANLGIVALWAWQSLVFLPDGRQVPYARMFEVTALTATATNTAPAAFGEAAGIAALAERAGVGAAIALSVFAQHHLVEGYAKLGEIVLASRFAPLPPWVRQSLGALAALVVAGTIALIVLARRPDRGPTFIRRWATSLVAMRSPSRFALGLAIAVGMKGAEALGWLAMQHAFGLSLGAGVPILALTAVNLASVLSATPGNIGLYEAAAYFVYSRQGVPHDLALAIGVTGHLCYLAALAGTGWVMLSGRAVAGALRRRA